MRKCKNKCGKALPTASKCTDIIQKKGYCSVDCLVYHTREKRIVAEKKKERKAHLEAKERVKRRSDWLREAQAAFNKYIRLRDKEVPCISCGKPDDGSHQRHASHFRSVGSCSSLRFDESNVHASCSVCNNYLSGNISGYTPALIKKIGNDEYERIISSPKSYKWTIEQLKKIKSEYSSLCKAMEKELS